MSVRERVSVECDIMSSVSLGQLNIKGDDEGQDQRTPVAYGLPDPVH
jgi:hypothetical protein